MICKDAVLQLHEKTVKRWHSEPISNSSDGVLGLICEQHGFNFRLWHEEDVARSRDATDAQIAQVKRNIDRFNQQRNDAIERIDDWIAAWIVEHRVAAVSGAPINSETAGSMIDRLSILSLRIYHLLEQLQRTDVDKRHHDSVNSKLATCYEQRIDLSTSLARQIDDLIAGRKRHKTYRQLKMYNDPSLNPYLYRKAG